MKRIIISALALSLLAGAAGTASAQPYGHDRHDNRGQYGAQWNNHQDWRRGGRIGHDDWRRGAVVDYRIHHLRRPPRGYEWREVDGRYVLAAAATGLIADIILNSR
jgi:Ni/Co efflux regulator RcnB